MHTGDRTKRLRHWKSAHCGKPPKARNAQLIFSPGEATKNTSPAQFPTDLAETTQDQAAQWQERTPEAGGGSKPRQEKAAEDQESGSVENG
ncbi:hypothetical protein NL676_009176 [Syzygium grande]|nr:hypothetical protein NL676_009176 [Syzygium grande]